MAPEQLDFARRKSIEDALEAYRKAVLEHNMSNLRVIVEALGSRDPAPDDMTRLCEVYFHHFHSAALSEIATSPRGLLEPETRSKLVQEWFLDGVYHLPESEQQDRTAWFAKIQTYIDERDVPVSVDFPPAELEYLCTLVDGIAGPGLPEYTFLHQYDMLSVATEHSISHIDEHDVTVGSNIPDILTDYAPEDLEITLCVKIGRNEEHSWGGSYILWTRHRSSQEQWAWRFAAHVDEEASDVYETVEEYLAYYAHHEEQSEARVRKQLRGLVRVHDEHTI